MIKNMGTIDRSVRLVIGLAIIVVGIILHSWWGLIGIIPILISSGGSCPAYMPFKFSTIKKKPADK